MRFENPAKPMSTYPEMKRGDDGDDDDDVNLKKFQKEISKFSCSCCAAMSVGSLIEETNPKQEYMQRLPGPAVELLK